MGEHNGASESRRGASVVIDGAEPVGNGASGEPLPRTRAWRIVALSIGALLLAIAIAGVVTIIENNRVHQITARSLSFDIEVEDEASDVLVAILNLRHIHRNIVFVGTSASTTADFDEAYEALLEELSELDRLNLHEMGLTQPARIRSGLDRYYADFRPALDRASIDPLAFQAASELGLSRLEAMANAADEIDNLGDRLADESLERTERALRTEQLLLTGLVIGVLLVGLVIAVASVRLLAQLRTLYEREQQGRRAIGRALQTKTDFIADASHELRTPLAVILGNAETALASNDERQHATALKAIAAEANRMGKLVDDLLFLARSDAGSPPLEKEYVPARWLVSRLVNAGEMLTRQRSSCLQTNLGGEGSYLEADPERIEQAILILIDNAARHSPAGACVGLTSRIEPGSLAIDVRDSGSGIAPEELPLIFDRFYQVKNRRSRKKGGSGLGLAIARSIIVAHDGTITVESQRGAGTTMTIRLPLAAPPDPDDTLDTDMRPLVVSTPRS